MGELWPAAIMSRISNGIHLVAVRLSSSDFLQNDKLLVLKMTRGFEAFPNSDARIVILSAMAVGIDPSSDTCRLFKECRCARSNDGLLAILIGRARDYIMTSSQAGVLPSNERCLSETAPRAPFGRGRF